MARPQRNNADYFSHDANFRNDPRIRAVRSKFGVTGYGTVCMLLEILTFSDGFSVEWSELSQEIYAGDVGVSAVEMQEIVSFCVKIHFFCVGNDNLSCPTLTEGLRPLVEKRQFLRQKHQSDGVSTAETPLMEPKEGVSAAETPQSKVEYSKVKKEEDLSESEQPAPDVENVVVPNFRRSDWTRPDTRRSVNLDELMKDFVVKMDNIPREYVECWWLHYESMRWEDGNGKPIEPAEKIRFKWRNGKERPKTQNVQNDGERNGTHRNNTPKAQSAYSERLGLNVGTLANSYRANVWASGAANDEVDNK